MAGSGVSLDLLGLIEAMLGVGNIGFVVVIEVAERSSLDCPFYG